MVAPIFNMDLKIEVLLGIAKLRSFRVILIVESVDCVQDAQRIMQFRRLRPENTQFEAFVVHSAA